MNRIRKHITPLAIAAVALFATAQPAFAIEASSPLKYENGVMTLDSAVPYTLGGTGQTTAPDDSVMVGNGSGWELKTLPDCDAGSQALEYDTTTNTFTCETISAGSTIYPEITFNSDGLMNQNGNTLYVGPGGKISSTEGNVSMPIGAATLSNLRCKASATVGGTSLVVTLASGACGGTLTASNVTVTPTGTTVVSDTSNTLSVTADQCVSLAAVATGDTNAIHLACSVQKTANS